MKKVFLSLCFAIAISMAGTQEIFAAKNPAKEEKSFTEEEIARFKEIESRVNEIKNMNFSDFSPEERREIKNELKALNKEAKGGRGTGLYISGTALIVIILLLIIIL